MLSVPIAARQWDAPAFSPLAVLNRWFEEHAGALQTALLRTFCDAISGITRSARVHTTTIP